jgi:spore coat protein U-like protein
VIGLLISYEVQMGSGVYGSTADRKMSNGGSLLSYNIFTNPARTIVWGNGAGGTGVKNNSYLLAFGASRTDTMQMYGKLPGGQNVSAGSYADMVVVTVVY